MVGLRESTGKALMASFHSRPLDNRVCQLGGFGLFCGVGVMGVDVDQDHGAFVDVEPDPGSVGRLVLPSAVCCSLVGDELEVALHAVAGRVIDPGGGDRLLPGRQPEDLMLTPDGAGAEQGQWLPVPAGDGHRAFFGHSGDGRAIRAESASGVLAGRVQRRGCGGLSLSAGF